MHRHIRTMVPVLESILSVGKQSLPVLSELQQLRAVVATSAASLFSEYEDSVARDGSKVLPMDGTIHPLTAQVVSYVKVRWEAVELGARVWSAPLLRLGGRPEFCAWKEKALQGCMELGEKTNMEGEPWLTSLYLGKVSNMLEDPGIPCWLL